MIKGCKICGIKDSDTLNFIINHQSPPTFIGFICNYPKSSRYVKLGDLKKLLSINKNKSNYIINGDNFDISNIYGDINKNSETKYYFSKKFNSNFQINIKKLYMQNDIYLSNVVGSAEFKNNTIKKAKIEAKLEKNIKIYLLLHLE